MVTVFRSLSTTGCELFESHTPVMESIPILSLFLTLLDSLIVVCQVGVEPATMCAKAKDCHHSITISLRSFHISKHDQFLCL